jgi:hypothetical protein
MDFNRIDFAATGVVARDVDGTLTQIKHLRVIFRIDGDRLPIMLAAIPAFKIDCDLLCSHRCLNNYPDASG